MGGDRSQSRPGVEPFFGGLVASDSIQHLVAYLAAVPGNACTFPVERIRELTGATLPDAAMSVAWWADRAGWHASPASRACLSAGWRLQSVHAAAGLVRFTRTGDDSPGGSPGGRGRDASTAPRQAGRRTTGRSGRSGRRPGGDA